MKLSLTNRHPSLRPPPSKWKSILRRLLRHSQMAGLGKPLHLKELSVVWMDDPLMAQMNLRFKRHQGPTDILTFDYGDGRAEILISIDTARRQARSHQQTTNQELALYLAHGILHLKGFRDSNPSQRNRMRKAESQLLEKI